MTLSDPPLNPVDLPADLSFEDALKELEAIVHKLEEGHVSLEEAVQAYERGAVLKDHCDQLLKSARLKIQEIMKTKDGATVLKPSELQTLVEE
jgi:exodeoxyribonuclease VII small subunit